MRDYKENSDKKERERSKISLNINLARPRIWKYNP
jgi:hypothetical protein